MSSNSARARARSAAKAPRTSTLQPDVRLSLTIDPQRHRRLKVYAAERGISIKDLIVGCVDALLAGK